MVAYLERRVPGNIFVSRVGEEAAEPLTTVKDGGIQSHAWSPDGQRIAYNVWIGDNASSAIWVIDLTSKSPSRLTFGSYDHARNPSWSPDGRTVAFQARMGYAPEDIYTIGTDGSDETNLTQTPEVSEQDPAWSPDGTLIAVRRFDQIALYSRSGSLVDILTRGGGIDYGPTWSPDGSLLAFESTRGGGSDVYVIAPDGSFTRRMTNYAVCCSMTPTWLPDGEALAIEVLGRDVVARVPVSGSVPAAVEPDAWGILKRGTR